MSECDWREGKSRSETKKNRNAKEVLVMCRAMQNVDYGRFIASCNCTQIESWTFNEPKRTSSGFCSSLSLARPPALSLSLGRSALLSSLEYSARFPDWRLVDVIWTVSTFKCICTCTLHTALTGSVVRLLLPTCSPICLLASPHQQLFYIEYDNTICNLRLTLIMTLGYLHQCHLM